ncbi:acyl-CoA carboxylase epsilon subunit [Knoellia sp. CPCC 206450]|uniref:acyl-CoA carboxylase epsilon subunit n=1 Tax=Knoellia tibetensis TaxID=3404798 RepID=UPI003B42EF3E
MTSSQAQSSGGPGALMMSQSEQEQPVEAVTTGAPVIEVVGDATPEQVAALVAVLSAAAGAAVTEAPARHTSAWSSPAGLVRRPVAPGPGAWSRSLRA